LKARLAAALRRLDAAAKMDAELSEGLFKSYLDLLGLRHERHVCVHGDKNVDFHVDGETPVLCDVKEIRPSPTDPDQIDAYSHLREDLTDLRKKFGPSKPVVPVLLVTMNFSGRLFTGFSVARAMLGDIGAQISPEGRSDIHHLSRGNAVMTRSHTTLISGIFVFDCAPQGNHAIFPNPYAACPLPDSCFPFVRRVCVAKDATEEDLKALANITFWQCD
jgi:hypothetical protein